MPEFSNLVCITQLSARTPELSTNAQYRAFRQNAHLIEGVIAGARVHSKDLHDELTLTGMAALEHIILKSGDSIPSAQSIASQLRTTMLDELKRLRGESPSGRVHGPRPVKQGKRHGLH